MSILVDKDNWPPHLMSLGRKVMKDGLLLYRPWRGEGININELGLRTAHGSTLFDQTDDRYFFDAVHLRGGEPARRGTHRCHSCCQLSLTSKLFISLIGTRVCISVHVTTRSRFGGSALEIAPFSAPL